MRYLGLAGGEYVQRGRRLGLSDGSQTAGSNSPELEIDRVPYLPDPTPQRRQRDVLEEEDKWRDTKD